METADRDLELRSRRRIHAPAELVYRAMTETDHIHRWWGPAGFRTTTESFDPRPGGEWRLTMHATDGSEFHNRIVFEELEPPSRIVYRHEPTEGTEPVAFRVTVELVPRGNQTEVRMTFRFATPEVRRTVVEAYGAERGNRETLNRLEAHLHSVRHPMVLTAARGTRSFRTVRDFAAPVRQVWDALTVPEQLARWWGGGGEPGKTEVRQFDLHPGGGWTIVEHGADGAASPFRGEFREVTPPKRLVYTMFLDVAGWRKRVALVSATLEEHEGGTRLTTTSEFATVAIRKAWLGAGAEAGGAEHFRRLADFLANPWSPS